MSGPRKRSPRTSSCAGGYSGCESLERTCMAIAAIVGAGLIGRAWAHVFARAGWQVRVWDPAPQQRESAAALIDRSLHDLARHGLVADPVSAAKRVVVVPTLAEAVAAADYVQE